MPLILAVIDTSVLLSLQCSETLGAISVLFTRVLVPRAVRTEITKGGKRNEGAARALSEYAFFEPCDDYDQESVQMLLATRQSLKAGKDEGEAEAVVQASQRSVNMVLIEDALGRKWAERFGLECHGSLWILGRLREVGYLRHVRPCFERLIRGQRRQPLESMNEILARFGEATLSSAEFDA